MSSLNSISSDIGMENEQLGPTGSQPSTSSGQQHVQASSNVSSASKEGSKRASQACQQCRKRKLRCLGGHPCQRCIKSHTPCRYVQLGSQRHALTNAGDASESEAPLDRIRHLEENFAHLIETLKDFPGRSSTANPMLSTGSNPAFQPTLTAPTPQPTGSHATFAPLPDDWMSQAIADTNSMATGEKRISGRAKQVGRGESAEARLAQATDGIFGAPFKALAYQPSLWDNREASRRNSPELQDYSGRSTPKRVEAYDRKRGRDKDDPINTGIVDEEASRVLFDFYVEHCHPFLPVIDIDVPDPYDTTKSCPSLFSAILAIASRFYERYRDKKMSSTTFPLLSDRAPKRLAYLAEFHLAQTILRKQHALGDVQACLLLAAWCLVGEGGGPDAWLVTGHAVRLMRRLGVHTVLARASDTVPDAKIGSNAWLALESVLPQWRTWLTWLGFDCMFSLGFGRPQSTHLENLDEAGLLHVRLSQPIPHPFSRKSVSLHGDMYTAGQVQLTRVARALREWTNHLADEESISSTRGNEGLEDRGAAIADMFAELNNRLDQWCHLWVWNDSPYAIHLGTSVRLSRLQADHVRLCINSYALKYASRSESFVGPCLKKAFNAAVAIIQDHFDSCKTDFALSFATDYFSISLGQAALFLIRIIRSPESVMATISLDPSVVPHYVRMSIDVMERGDLSETRLSTFLARTIRDIARVAGVDVGDLSTSQMSLSSTNLFAQGSEQQSEQPSYPQNDTLNHLNFFMSNNLHTPFDDLSSGDGLPMMPSGPQQTDTQAFPDVNASQDPNASNAFDIDAFLQLDPYSDLGSLLGLSYAGYQNDFTQT